MDARWTICAISKCAHSRSNLWKEWVWKGWEWKEWVWKGWEWKAWGTFAVEPVEGMGVERMCLYYVEGGASLWKEWAHFFLEAVLHTFTNKPKTTRPPLPDEKQKSSCVLLSQRRRQEHDGAGRADPQAVAEQPLSGLDDPLRPVEALLRVRIRLQTRQVGTHDCEILL